MIRTSLHHPRNHLWVARRQKERIRKMKKKKQRIIFFLLQTAKVTSEVNSYIPSASSSLLHLVYLCLSFCNRWKDCYKKDRKRDSKSRKNGNFPAFPRLFVISSRLLVNKKRVKKHMRAKIIGNQWAVFLTATDFLDRGRWAGREVWVRNVTRSVYCVLEQDTWPSQCLCASQCLTVPPSRSIKKYQASELTGKANDLLPTQRGSWYTLSRFQPKKPR